MSDKKIDAVTEKPGEKNLASPTTEAEKKTDQAKNKVQNEPNSKIAAPPEKSAKTEKKVNSWKFVRGYARKECGSLVFGTIFLIGANLSDLAVPKFIGIVIDLFQK